ncbi:MAG: phage tail protein [Chloroflexi bacterium]|jgi:phage tail-like protein|nr:phage tail protein [Chloroflexota bacterium]
MRGRIDGLPTPHPLGSHLPGLYLEDDFAQRLTSALDEVAAPIILDLDNLDAYLDPRLAPEDFLDWVGRWVGVELDATWPVDRRRALVAAAVDIHRVRGTAAGIASLVALSTGGEVEIAEPGAAGFSMTPGAAVPAGTSPDLYIRVRVPDPGAVSLARLDALVRAAKPAHLPHRVEVVAG